MGVRRNRIILRPDQRFEVLSKVLSFVYGSRNLPLLPDSTMGSPLPYCIFFISNLDCRDQSFLLPVFSSNHSLPFSPYYNCVRQKNWGCTLGTVPTEQMSRTVRVGKYPPSYILSFTSDEVTVVLVWGKWAWVTRGAKYPPSRIHSLTILVGRWNRVRPRLRHVRGIVVGPPP